MSSALTRLGSTAGGLVAHTLLAAAPLAVAGALGVSPVDRAIAAALALGSVQAAVELWRAFAPDQPPPERLPAPVATLARASGLVLLLGTWAGLTEHLVLGGGHVGAGVGLAAAGVGLRAWAVVTLGPRFRTELALLPGATLERGGPYRWLRHPSEWGLVLGALGQALLLGSVGAAAFTLLGTLPLAVLRARAEDEVLRRPTP